MFDKLQYGGKDRGEGRRMGKVKCDGSDETVIMSVIRSEREEWGTGSCRTEHIKKKGRRGINVKFVNMHDSHPKPETEELTLS